MEEEKNEKSKQEINEDKGAEELNKENNELDECKKTRDEYLAGWQRARADFLNYKKDEIERIEGLVAYSNEELILKLLPIIDNFDLVEKKISEDLKNNENVKGLLQVKIQMLDFLKKYNVEEIKSVGEKFDPNFHEAVETAELENGESNKIVEEIKKGYIINGRLLRPAKVRIAR